MTKAVCISRHVLRGLLAAAALCAPFVALAVENYPPIICTQLFGCGRGPEDVLMTSTIPLVGTVMVQLAAGGAVLAIVIAGVQMAVSGGEDGKLTTARKGIMYAIGGLALVLAATSLVSFVATENYGQSDPDLLFGSAGVIASVVRIIMILFNVGFVIVVIIAGIQMVISAGSADTFKKAGNMIKWAIIGGIVVNAARALIQALLMLQF